MFWISGQGFCCSTVGVSSRALVLCSFLLIGLMSPLSQAADSGDQAIVELPASAATFVTDAQVVGSGRLSYLFWDIYQLSFWRRGSVESDQVWPSSQPVALVFSYLRSVAKERLVSSTLDELRRQGVSDVQLSDWGRALLDLWPDVKPGSQLAVVYQPASGTQFFEGERSLGVIEDAEFGPAFFNIWLGENTSEPELRRQLLGLE